MTNSGVAFIIFDSRNAQRNFTRSTFEDMKRILKKTNSNLYYKIGAGVRTMCCNAFRTLLLKRHLAHQTSTGTI